MGMDSKEFLTAATGQIATLTKACKIVNAANEIAPTESVALNDGFGVIKDLVIRWTGDIKIVFELVEGAVTTTTASDGGKRFYGWSSLRDAYPTSWSDGLDTVRAHIAANHQ